MIYPRLLEDFHPLKEDQEQLALNAGEPVVPCRLDGQNSMQQNVKQTVGLRDDTHSDGHSGFLEWRSNCRARTAQKLVW